MIDDESSFPSPDDGGDNDMSVSVGDNDMSVSVGGDNDNDDDNDDSDDANHHHDDDNSSDGNSGTTTTVDDNNSDDARASTVPVSPPNGPATRTRSHDGCTWCSSQQNLARIPLCHSCYKMWREVGLDLRCIPFQEIPKDAVDYLEDEGGGSYYDDNLEECFCTGDKDDSEDYDLEEDLRSSRARAGNVVQNPNTIRKKKMSDDEIKEKYREDAGIVFAFLALRESPLIKNEKKPANARALLETEKKFFYLLYREYEARALRNGSDFLNPLKVWSRRWKYFQRKFLSPAQKEEKLQLLQKIRNFATQYCSKEERFVWLDFWDRLYNELVVDAGNLESFRILAVIFVKCTNGTSDKVSCKHFREILGNPTNNHYNFWRNITLGQIVEDRLLLPSLIRQCGGCWIKFSVALQKIFQELHDRGDWNKGAGFPESWKYWIQLAEFRSKSVALLMAICKLPVPTMPMDSHLFRFFLSQGLTNGKSNEEVAWQVAKWIDPKDFIKTNDCIGAIGQALNSNKKRPGIFRRANACELQTVLKKFYEAKSKK